VCFLLLPSFLCLSPFLPWFPHRALPTQLESSLISPVTPSFPKLPTPFLQLGLVDFSPGPLFFSFLISLSFFGFRALYVKCPQPPESIFPPLTLQVLSPLDYSSLNNPCSRLAHSPILAARLSPFSSLLALD